MNNVMDPGAHSHSFCFDFMFCHWSKILSARMKIVENVESAFEETREIALGVSEVQDQPSTDTRCLEV